MSIREHIEQSLQLLKKQAFEDRIHGSASFPRENAMLLKLVAETELLPDDHLLSDIDSFIKAQQS